MKKLICAAIVAGSIVAMADEAAKDETAAPVAAEAVKVAPKRPKITPEQREKMHEQREKMREQRQKMREMSEKRKAEYMAKKEAQALEIVKKYVPEEEKAKALVKELQDVLMAGRRNMMRPSSKPAAAKPVETN